MVLGPPSVTEESGPHDDARRIHKDQQETRVRTKWMCGTTCVGGLVANTLGLQ